MFVIGSIIHYAMARHVMGATLEPTDELIVEQFVQLMLGGLEARAVRGRRAKGKHK
jgi:uncharacterized membrane protein